MTDIRALEYEAEVRQVKTMVDGTFNVTLNLPEYCAEQAAVMMKSVGGVVKSVSVFEDKKEAEDRGV